MPPVRAAPEAGAAVWPTRRSGDIALHSAGVRLLRRSMCVRGLCTSCGSPPGHLAPLPQKRPEVLEILALPCCVYRFRVSEGLHDGIPAVLSGYPGDGAREGCRFAGVLCRDL